MAAYRLKHLTLLHLPDSAAEIFEGYLLEKGVTFERIESDRYVIKRNGSTSKVSLNNVAREFERDKDPDRIRRFADQVLGASTNPDPSWPAIRPYLRFQLEPDDYNEGLERTVKRTVSEGLLLVLVYVSADEGLISWVMESDLKSWSVTAAEAFEHADQNMEKLASAAEIEVDNRGNIQLGMINTEASPFKASILLARNFRKLVEPAFGFPVLAVAPCRDFVLLISNDRTDLLPRLGVLVLQEFNNSPYSITTDVLRISEEGVAAIGGFGPSKGG